MLRFWPFHKHDWKAEVSGPAHFGRTNQTAVLYICACEKSKLKFYRGAWYPGKYINP